MVNITRTEAEIAGPIMAAKLSGVTISIVVLVSGVVDAMVGVEVTTSDEPGARVDSCTPGVSPGPSTESSGGVMVQQGKAKVSQGGLFCC